MAHRTPRIQDAQLWLPHQRSALCPVGSAEWFTWLQTATTFRFLSTQRRIIIHGHGPLLAPISLRKEHRRHAAFWYAYRRASGHLLKRYAGRSDDLTLDCLNAIASDLHYF